MVAAGCEFRSRFTGYESKALSPDFIMEAAGGRFECRERRVGRRRFGCCDRVAASFEVRRLRGAGLVGARRGGGRRELRGQRFGRRQGEG
jgi:hypothetical protein